MLRSWLAARILTRSLDALNRGDIRPTLRMEAPDVHFRFPGSNSWAIEATNRGQVEAWLRRLAAIGLQLHAHEVVVSGPPWRMTLVMRGTDHFDGPDGSRVYENRYVIWALTRWGRIHDYEVYEDTEKATAFDAWLAANGPAEVRPSPTG
jgi:ketosteroid isomerase-like protein